jgi:hypothetical protein
MMFLTGAQDPIHTTVDAYPDVSRLSPVTITSITTLDVAINMITTITKAISSLSTRTRARVGAITITISITML